MHYRNALSYEDRKRLPPWKAQTIYKKKQEKIILQMYREVITGEEALEKINALMEAYYGIPYPK